MDIRDRWINLLHHAATGTKKTRSILTPVGMVIFGVFTALFVILALLFDRWFPVPWPLSNSLSWFAALLLICVGMAITAWSALHFLKVKGTPVPFNPPPELVITGPYRFARNPMLTGVFLLLFGIGFAIKSPSLIVIFIPLYILANVWELKAIEEPELVKRLGEDYVAYRLRTPMFIPTLPTKK